MYKTTVYFILTSMILMVMMTCKDSPTKTIEEPFTNESLLGTWESERSVLVFKENQTFIDSTYLFSSPESPLYTCEYDEGSSSENSTKTLDRVIHGEYYVTDSTIVFQKLELIESCFLFFRFIPYLEKTFHFENDTLTLHSFKEFDRMDTNTGLSGAWRSSYSTLSYPIGVADYPSFIEIHQTIEFDTLSGKVYGYGGPPLEDNEISETPYYYDPPYFSPFIGVRPVTQKLILKENKMLLFDEFSTSHVRKN